MSEPLTAADVAERCGLDAATRARLETHVAMLADWSTRMNLVGRSTLADPWRRHVLDSAQVFAHLPQDCRTLVDMGSGAGFPGLVLAIMGVPEVTLIEATQKKCTFLRAVAEATATPVEIRAERLEATEQAPVDVVTARALAPVGDLLRLGRGFIARGTTCLFLKGARAERELTEAAADWKMTIDRHPSLSHPDGVLLELDNVQSRARR